MAYAYARARALFLLSRPSSGEHREPVEISTWIKRNDAAFRFYRPKVLLNWYKQIMTEWNSFNFARRGRRARPLTSVAPATIAI